MCTDAVSVQERHAVATWCDDCRSLLYMRSTHTHQILQKLSFCWLPLRSFGMIVPSRKRSFSGFPLFWVSFVLSCGK